MKAALEREGPLWIRQVEVEQQDKRRLVVGAVALTAANLGGLQDWRNARALIEWACELVRKNARPGEAERTFHWAGISLLEAAADAAPLQSHVSPRAPAVSRGAAIRSRQGRRDGAPHLAGSARRTDIPRDRDPRWSDWRSLAFARRGS